MIIYILNENLKILDILRGYTFCETKENIRSIKGFKINVEKNERNKMLLDKTKTFYLLFDKEQLGIITRVEKDADYEDENTITIKGKTAQFILTKRVVLTNVDFKGKPYMFVRQVIEKGFSRNLNRRYLNYSFEYSNVDEMTKQPDITKSVTGGYVWKAIEPVLKEYRLGVQVFPVVTDVPVIDAFGNETNVEKLIFKISAGSDRTKQNKIGNKPVILSQSLSNISRSSYKLLRENSYTTCIIAGEGEGEQRVWDEIPREGMEQKVGINRTELWVDARDLQSTRDDGTVIPETQYKQLLRTRALEKLSENNQEVKYEATLSNNNKRYVYGKDFELCDFITVEDLELEIEESVQVVEITKSYLKDQEIIDFVVEYY